MNTWTPNEGNTMFAPGAPSFVAGVLIGLSIVGPVFAATDEVTDQWSLWLLIGSAVLLLIGLVLKVLSASRSRNKPTTEPVRDMRRDRVAEVEVDHSLGLASIPGRHVY